MNPRAFSPPARLDSWVSRAVLGERVRLARTEVPIPRRFAVRAQGLCFAATIGIPPLAWALWSLELLPVLGGLALSCRAKMAFLNVMVRLHDHAIASGSTVPGRPAP